MLSDSNSRPPVADTAVPDTADAVRQLAHDLQNPLHEIRQIAYYLDMALPVSDVRSRRRLTALQRHVRLARWILDDALMSIDSAPPQFTTVDMKEMISHAIVGWQAEHTAWLILDIEEGLPLVRADVGQMEQLLRRLVLFVAGDSGRATRVRCRASGGGVALELTPPGPMEFPPALVSPSPRGAGAALAAARRIIDAHGGRVELERDSADRVKLRILFPAA